MRYILFFLILTSFIGCASVKELGKKIWGSSTEALEEARKDGLKKTVNLDYETSFDKITDILKELKCQMYIKDKRRHIIVAINFQGPKDTTEVGLFFAEKDSDQTEIELSSISSSILNYAAEKIFSQID
jgi:hypothetical protein